MCQFCEGKTSIHFADSELHLAGSLLVQTYTDCSIGVRFEKNKDVEYVDERGYSRSGYVFSFCPVCGKELVAYEKPVAVVQPCKQCGKMPPFNEALSTRNVRVLDLSRPCICQQKAMIKL